MDAVGKTDVQEYTSNGNFSHTSKSCSVSIPVSSNELNSNNENDGGLHEWAKIKIFLRKLFRFEVMSPHDKYVEHLNRFVLASCILAIFIDPLFFYLLSAKKEYKCIVINWPIAIVLMVSRSITDLIYFLRMLMEFRIGFISPESRVVGTGDLVDGPIKIMLRYLSGFFFLDLLIVLPVPQIIVLFIQPNGLSSPGARNAKFLLQTVTLIQYAPRLYRFLPVLAGQSPSGFIFESTWANFVINFLAYVLAGHVIGSCWYMLGLLRVNKCLEGVCRNSTFADCKKFIDCGRGTNYGSLEGYPEWNVWKQDENLNACFSEDGTFNYGIYKTAVNLITENSLMRKYVYSSFWGLQQISTLGGNQIPSYYEGEVFFSMGIIGLGLLLLALLIGNMQNFLQGLGRRRLEKSLRRRDVEQWLSHRRVPEDIRRKVRESEHHNWVATRGVNEEMIMENLPEDLQRDIRRHIFKFVKQVRIFSLVDEPILDAICERLREKTYIKGGTVLYKGGFVTKMVFIVRGKMQSINKDGKKVLLSECHTCGEELLEWYLEHSSRDGDTQKERKKGNQLRSNRTVKCLTNVEAFVLRAADIKEVITLFDGFSMNHHVQFSIRNQSPYWKGVAATSIQLAWRHRKKLLNRAKMSHGYSTRPSTSNLM